MRFTTFIKKVEIDLLVPQPTRLTKSATSCSTIHKKGCELSFDVKPGGLSAAATII